MGFINLTKVSGDRKSELSGRRIRNVLLNKANTKHIGKTRGFDHS